MTPSDCLRYIAAIFLIWHDRDAYWKLRGWAIEFEHGDVDSREVIIDALRAIVARFAIPNGHSKLVARKGGGDALGRRVMHLARNGPVLP